PDDVEEVIGGAPLVAADAGRFAVEDDLVDRQVSERLDDRRVGVILGELVARQQADVIAVLEGKQTDAIELLLECPVRSSEALLGERGRHRLDPVRKGRRHPRSTYFTALTGLVGGA